MKNAVAFLAVVVALSNAWSENPQKGIDRQAIRAVISENIKTFEACYKRLLQKNPETYGKLEMKWEIIDGGKAQKARVVKSTISDSLFEECMIAALVKLKFPEPPDEQVAEVSYPFIFSDK